MVHLFNNVFTMKQKLTTAAAALIGIAGATLPAWGAPIDFFNATSPIYSASGLSTQSAMDLMLNIIKGALQVVGIIALALFIYGGFTIMTARGNEENITKGRSILTWATIGIIIIFSSLGIILFIDRAVFR